jgi:CoA-transferase family III
MSALINTPDRAAFTAADIIANIWHGLGLPKPALKSVELTGQGLGLPSSYRIGPIAQSTIALSALSAALIHSIRNKSSVPTVSVPLQHAVAEYKSERLYILGGRRNEDPWGPVGGLHKTADGYVRLHGGFAHHLNGALRLLGLDSGATRETVTIAASKWKSTDLEAEAFRNGVVIAALRSYSQWDILPQAQAVANFPIGIRKLADGVAGLPERMQSGSNKCLRGLRVLELSRVIAAPVAGRTLAAHGADVLWVTSPTLPDLPAIDCDFARGKRTIQLDLRIAEDKKSLLELARTADVIIQGYRPGSLATLGLSTADILAVNPNIIYANMSAYGPAGPWSGNRGFDSLVQTCSGMNVSEAEHFGTGLPARPAPCQVLDHASGYLMATGIVAALFKRATEGGSYVIDVSLAGTMKYLRSLGQYPGRSGFECPDIASAEQVVEFLETRRSGLGELTAVRHSATVDGLLVGWDLMPKPLGSDQVAWLE